MTPDRLFALVNAAALISWCLLAVFPGTPVVRRLIAARLVPALLALVYVTLVVSQWGSPGGFSSLGQVARLFTNPWMLLAGWVHYLAFDLLIGASLLEDAQARGVRYVFVVPCLALTFLFGPAGWLLYQGVRRAAVR